jgi:predicted DNA repair protein MutK
MTGGIFAILDDIAVLMDDVAVMSKVAAKKTAGILGDDLAVNAEKATGFKASRELPVLWAITKGSFLNKVIILPFAFLLSAFAPWLIVPILLVGGAYLSYEGMEKIHHSITHRSHRQPQAKKQSDRESLLRVEKAKIKSAIRTDFILSIEIIMITLGTVMQESLLLQIMVVSLIALLATVGVYGLVALLVRMDDAGFYLVDAARNMAQGIGNVMSRFGMFLVKSLPVVIRALTVIGTIAMLLVGGGMFTHNLHFLHEMLHAIPSVLGDLLVGIVVGSILVGGHLLIRVAVKR